MNSQKTLLIGLLVTAAAIVLFETGTLRLDQNTLQAQAGMGGVDYGLDGLPICIGFVSVGTVPVGALTGLMRGAIKQGKAVEYIIGPSDWQIVQ